MVLREVQLFYNMLDKDSTNIYRWPSTQDLNEVHQVRRTNLLRDARQLHHLHHVPRLLQLRR